MAQTAEDLEQLAETCLATARTLKKHLAETGHAQPTFDQNGPSFWPSMKFEAECARMELRNASRLLYQLASGPDDIVAQAQYNAIHDLNAYRYVFRYKIAAAVPLNASMSYAELAAMTGTAEGQLKQMLRQLMTTQVFAEPRLNQVVHTASSKLLLDVGIGAMNAWICEDSMPMIARQVDAIEKWGHGSQEPDQTPVQLRWNTDKLMFAAFEDLPGARTRFSQLMTFVSDKHIYSAAHLNKYDWKALGECTIVDVAGSMGHCSVLIAQSNPKAKCIVQDLPNVIARAEDAKTSVVPDEGVVAQNCDGDGESKSLSLRERISFMSHDYFEPQPVKNADVYFLRMVLHHYSDKYCGLVLNSIIPAMGPRSKIVVMDQVVPPFGQTETATGVSRRSAVPSWPWVAMRAARTQNLMMMSLFNAKERQLDEWQGLTTSVDSRLKITKVISPPGSVMSMIEIVLEVEPEIG